jgi:hypothetical protein
MVQCPACGYNTWRTAACAFCGAPFATLSDDISEAGPPQAPAAAPSRPVEAAGGFPSLFLLWFLLGLLAGLVGFSPRARAAGALFWPGAEQLQEPVRQDSIIGSPVPLAWRDPEPDRGAPETR